MMRAPSPAKPAATARPMPELPPVTNATFPFSFDTKPWRSRNRHHPRLRLHPDGHLRMEVSGLAIAEVRQYFAAFLFDVVMQTRHPVGKHERLEPLMLPRAIEHQKTAATCSNHFAPEH